MTPRPHRGSVLAGAVWIGGPRAASADARRDALSLWAPGASIHALDGGLLVRFREPRRLRCEQAPGAVLVAAGGRLWAWVPSPSELAGASAGEVHRLRGGVATTVPLASLPEVDPAEWLAVEGDVVTVSPLGEPPAPLVTPVPRTVRERLGRPEAPEAAALRAELAAGPPKAAVAEALARLTSSAKRGPASRIVLGAVATLGTVAMLSAGLLGSLFGGGAARSAAGAPAGAGGALAPSGPGWLERLFGGDGAAAPGGGPGWLARLFGGEGSAGAGGRTGRPGWLARLFARAPSAGGSPGSPAASSRPSRAPAPRGPGLLSRLGAALFGPLLAPRQGRYLGELLDLFEKGDFDAALRRAIPLSDGKAAPLPPALGLPSVRTDLQLRFGRGGPTSSIGMEAELMQRLRDTYQRALDALVAQGRIDEAAFLLVELLRQPQKAIDLLERHQRWETAAEIAEGALDAPAIAARLWVRAGKLDRVVQLARRTGTFAECLPAVEAADAVRGKAFRAAWAAHLAAGGDPAGAVGLCWPVPDLRPLALRWVDEAVARGSAAGIRLLPLRLAGAPERFDEVRAAVDRLLAGDTDDDVALRGALAEGLLQADSDGARALAVPVARRRVIDQARRPALVPAPQPGALAKHARDEALQVDLPPPAPIPAASTDPVRHAIDAGDRGAAAIADVALLPRGRLLVALGEAGARILDRSGAVRHVLDEPAHGFALHEAGGRAILVARRPDGVRLARADLDVGTVERWIDAPITTFAPAWRGGLWFVAEGNALVALDPLAERPTAVWRVDTGGPVRSIVLTADRLYAWVDEPVRQVWRYDLANLRLRERRALQEPGWPAGWLAGDGAFVEAADAVAPDGTHGMLPVSTLRPDATTPESAPVPLPDEVRALHVTRLDRAANLLVVCARSALGADVLLVDAATRARRAHVALLGARGAVVRIADDKLVVGDDLGRVEVISLTTRARVGRARV